MIPLKASSFVDNLKKIATDYKTVYAWGMFGSPITRSLVKQKAKQYPAWYTKNKIDTVFMPLYGKAWGFDCVGLVKGVLWGWNGDCSKTNGGAFYASGGIPDVSADRMIAKCSNVSTDFTSLSVGEFLWMKGHCGVYIGDGLAVESTPKWRGGVQITAVGNIGRKSGYNTRTWTKHGKLPYVTYDEKEATTVTIDMAVLKKGAKSEQVKTLQRLLLSMGYGLGRYGADGDFGDKTEAAVRAYQKAESLTSDGVVGKNTWSAILGVK